MLRVRLQLCISVCGFESRLGRYFFILYFNCFVRGCGLVRIFSCQLDDVFFSFYTFCLFLYIFVFIHFTFFVVYIFNLLFLKIPYNKGVIDE